MKKVFLGGTWNESKWRDELIKVLKIDYFNPIVEDWTPECMANELIQRDICDFLLYVITPRMKGVYSIAEVIDDSNKHPSRTIFCILHTDAGDLPESKISFGYRELKSLNAVGAMVQRNGGLFLNSLGEVAKYLNNAEV